MKPLKITNEALRSLNPNALNDIQKEYVAQRLSGMSCKQIADAHNVCLQYVYKVLWAAIETRNYTNPRVEFVRLSKPQQQCVYKNFALEIKNRGLKLFSIAAALGIPSSKLSYYLYNVNKLPLQVALDIQKQFFPDLSLEYLFERNLTPKRIDYDFDCAYPLLKSAMKEKCLLVADLADILNMSEDKMLHILCKGEITYEDAMTLCVIFFEESSIKSLFESAASQRNI